MSFSLVSLSTDVVLLENFCNLVVVRYYLPVLPGLLSVYSAIFLCYIGWCRFRARDVVFKSFIYVVSCLACIFSCRFSFIIVFIFCLRLLLSFPSNLHFCFCNPTFSAWNAVALDEIPSLVLSPHVRTFSYHTLPKDQSQSQLLSSLPSLS